jgi:hypothetical protein
MPGAVLANDNEFFNTKLAQCRTIIEHRIGILKSRFPILKCLNIKIKRKQDIGKMVEIVTACVILHNFLLQEPDVSWEYYKEVAEELMEGQVFSRPQALGFNITINEDRGEQIKEFIIDNFHYGV